MLKKKIKKVGAPKSPTYWGTADGKCVYIETELGRDYGCKNLPNRYHTISVRG